ncbi:MAG: class I SAM-dependent methyltransferase [Syntrophorhabdaceae bacterium]|nr:class I SAM-dependent methyltransferase [Syntrophorhabdaceae bacterium]
MVRIETKGKTTGMGRLFMLKIFVSLSLSICMAGYVLCKEEMTTKSLDQRVSKFLEERRDQWFDLNVSYQDGKILHDFVVKNRFTRILEIGTSTGHSTIWLAWAAAKTGGRVVTIEIDRGRYEQAIENFKKAGVSSYIDAINGDARKVVTVLNGPFDFVFSDADKEWYINYFKELKPRITKGGCFAAHNVLGWSREARYFLDYVKKEEGFKTFVERGSGEGISISCKMKGE